MAQKRAPRARCPRCLGADIKRTKRDGPTERMCQHCGTLWNLSKRDSVTGYLKVIGWRKPGWDGGAN
jgi:hypothetical protein